MSRHLILASVLIVACGVTVHAAETVANPDPARFQAEIRRFEFWDRKNAVPQGAILFVGSSSIRLWRTADGFPDLPLVNRGFGGSHVSDVNHFAERIVIKYAPRVIVFYAGDNDIAAGKPAQQVVEDTRDLIELVHRRLPDTQIVYLPIKPSSARWDKWPQMHEVNVAIKSLAAGDERLDYVDTASVLLGDDGRPQPELFLDDGLHLNRQGYELWSAVLRPVLEHR